MSLLGKVADEMLLCDPLKGECQNKERYTLFQRQKEEKSFWNSQNAVRQKGKSLVRRKAKPNTAPPEAPVREQETKVVVKVGCLFLGDTRD